jgi:hypothetical protein
MREARFVRDEGVAGSNPATPTTLPESPKPSPDSFPDRNRKGRGEGITFLRAPEPEDTVRRDARDGCQICDGLGWHWGWDQCRQPVMLRCPCVDRNRAEPQVHISSHAVVRYRERVIACPERERSDSMLKNAMTSIMRGRLPKKFKKTNFVAFKPWGILVFHRGYVTTVLGPGMLESRR